MTTFLAFTIAGIAVGCGYAVASLGLVVTYTTSGIFNFAHGAIGMVMAFAYWELHVKDGWPAPLALIFVLFVLAPLAGALIERLLMRRLHGSSTGTTLVVTLGLMLALIGFAQKRWPGTQTRVMPEFFAGHQVGIFGVNVTYHQLTVVALAAAVAGGLRLFFYRTRTGIAMRAVVDDPELSALNGASPARIAQLSWALGASLAALAGILLAPLVYLDIITLTLLVVSGYAAAIVGRLKSLPLTFAGAIVLGLLENYFVAYTNNKWFIIDRLNLTKFVLPTIFFFIVLLTMPQVRLRAGRLVGGRSPRVPRLRESVVYAVAFVIICAVIAPQLSFRNINNASQAMAIGIIMLSLLLLIGYSGQVSLMQLTFAGLGAFAMGKVAGGGSPLGLLAAAGFAAPFGLLAALPALRLTGLYLALATLAFAKGMETIFFNNPHIFGFGGRLPVGRLSLLGVSFKSERAYFVLLSAFFAAGAVGVLAIRRGAFGRRLAAMSDSPAACATLGLNQVSSKAIVFMTSAAMAGVGGALYGGARGAISPNDFLMLQSLVLLLFASAGGINTVAGVFVGAVLFKVAPTDLAYLIAGVVGMLLGFFPNGLAGIVGDLWDRRRRGGEVETEVEALPEDMRLEVDRLAGVAG